MCDNTKFQSLESPAEKKTVYYKQVFYISMATMAFIWVLMLFLTGGYSMRSVLYQEGNQSFMDFFNSMLYNIRDPYENFVFYPPLATLLYKFLLGMVPQQTIDALVFNKDANGFSTDLKTYQQFMVPLILYSLITFIGIFFALYYSKKGGRKERGLFTILMLTSAPMLFMFERANNIVIVLVLVLAFYALYNSDKKLYRELALICLALAIATKLYPVVFCAMLFTEKRYKDTVKVLIYSLILLVLPFFIFYDGITSIKLLLTNVSNFGDKLGLSVTTQLNFAKMMIFPLSKLNISNEALLGAGEAFRTVVMFCAVPAALFLRKGWKCAALCCCIIYGYQGTCATYLLILFALPIIMMLDNEKEHSVKNYVYLALMILTTGLMVSINPVTGQFTRFISTKISSYAVLAITCMLCYDGLKELLTAAVKLTGGKKVICGITAAGCVLFVVLASIFVAPGSIFDIIKIPVISGGLISGHMKNILLSLVGAAIFAGVVILICLFRKDVAASEDNNIQLLRQFVKFGIVGVSNTLISLAVYYIFCAINPSLYFLGNIVGFVVSVVNAYYWNNRFVFKATEGSKRVYVILKTFISYGFTFILSSLLLVLMVEKLNISEFLAPILNLFITIPLNFILNKVWAFGDNRASIKKVFANIGLKKNSTKDKTSGKDNETV